MCSKCVNGNSNGGYHGNGQVKMSTAKIGRLMGPIPEGKSYVTKTIEGVGRVTCRDMSRPWYNRPGHFSGTVVSTFTVLFHPS